jgi:hypothetical protein
MVVGDNGDQNDGYDQGISSSMLSLQKRCWQSRKAIFSEQFRKPRQPTEKASPLLAPIILLIVLILSLTKLGRSWRLLQVKIFDHRTSSLQKMKAMYSLPHTLNVKKVVLDQYLCRFRDDSCRFWHQNRISCQKGSFERWWIVCDVRKNETKERKPVLKLFRCPENLRSLCLSTSRRWTFHLSKICYRSLLTLSPSSGPLIWLFVLRLITLLGTIFFMQVPTW